MSNHIKINITRKGRKLHAPLKKITCLSLILLLLIGFLNLNINTSNPLEQVDNLNQEKNFLIDNLKQAADPSIVKPPYVENFNETYDFFTGKYNSSYDNAIYYRYGDEDGDITNDNAYSLDNLLFLKTMEKLKKSLSPSETSSKYEDLQSTPLWINEGNYTGFIRSINGSDGEIIDGDRYIIDNLIPILLLIDNYDSQSRIAEMFTIINSTEFWDDTNKGFLHSNSSTGSKSTVDNLYGIIACTLINRTTQIADTDLKNQAFNLANQTMLKLIEKMWANDSDNYGFNWTASSNWNMIITSDNNKYLEGSALGIIALLDYWMETKELTYLKYATNLYDKIDQYLWNSTEGAYMNSTGALNWKNPVNSWEKSLNIEGNALMMSACLKLFKVTGNIKYYNRAFNIYDFCESIFYDDVNKAYNWTTYLAIDDRDDKNFHANLKLIEAYIEALDIYNEAVLTTEYNVTENIPDYIFNQEIMNLTSTYTYSSLTNTTYITNASITFILRYPNTTIIEEIPEYFYDGNMSHSLIYNITDSLPIGNGYSITVYVNTSMFHYIELVKHFNVISGLTGTTLYEGERNLSGSMLFQGPTLNVSLPIESIRSKDINLTVTMQGTNIDNETLEDVTFNSNNETRVYFNLTTKTNAVIGSDIITFRLTKGSVLYLEINISIEIGNSFDYTYPVYESEVVSGDSVDIHLNLINILEDDPQSVNVSFSGTAVVNDPEIHGVTLNPKETKAVSYSINVSGSESIQIVMDLMKQDTIYYTETLTVRVVQQFEIISTSFPSTTPQWDYAHLIIKIQSNQDDAEDFSLTVNGVAIATNINQLVKGENQITASILSTLNPYEFGTKSYNIVLRDSSGEIIVSYHYVLTIALSPLALFLCYILPILFPIGIVLYYKNQDIKNKLLRR